MFATTIIKRRQERFFDGQVEEGLLKSIALGIANAIDRALFNRAESSPAY